ncbi:MAG: HlyC/CorC family transporter [Chloroflexi bacterium HGW-Chloroflexi-9]|nr:MAG: HlyC/CorC family transporter [Chloroflexi bacterium HGW-Chloroflexi-9]
MTTALTVVILLILLNALYVAAEFAAVSSRQTRVRQAAEGGSGAARWVLTVLSSPAQLDRYVACSQVGITLSSLVLGAFGQATLTPILADALESAAGMSTGAALGTAATAMLVLLTGVQVVIGELLPKSIALQFPTQAVIYTAYPMRGSLWLFRPLIAVLNGSGMMLLRLLRAPAAGHRHIHSPEEISLLIAESYDGGLFSQEEQERFDRALRLSVLPVRRLMVPRLDIVAVEASLTLAEVQRTLAQSAFTRLPVYEGNTDRIVGVLHAKTVAHRIAVGEGHLRATDVMRPIASVPESMRAERLVAELRRQRSEQAVVVDEHGGVAGLVTLEDLLLEVLGDTDSAPGGEDAPVRLPDGRLRMSGRMRVDEAHEWLGVLWEGDSDTVGGIVAEALGRVPQPGDRALIEGVEVEVESVEHLAVNTLLVRPFVLTGTEE